LETDQCYDGIQKDHPHLNVDVPFKRQSPGRGKRGVKAEELTGKQKTPKTLRRHDKHNMWILYKG